MGLIMFYSEISFDWYEATVFFGYISSDDEQAFSSTVSDFIADMLDDLPEGYSVFPVTARNGWKNAANVAVGSFVFCTISWSHSSATRNCLSVRFTGSNATRGSVWLRENFPDHSVTRVDVAADTVFELPAQQVSSTHMFEQAISKAKELGLKTNVVGDWFGEGGKTLYIGSMKSAYMMRIYEKGKQEDNAAIAGKNWVRFELVCRPDKRRRADCSFLSPIDFMGGWQFSKEIVSIFYQPVEKTDTVNKIVRQKTDLENALYHMTRQYKNHLTELYKSCSSLSEFGERIVEIMQPESLIDYEHHSYLSALSDGGCTDNPPLENYMQTDFYGFD